MADTMPKPDARTQLNSIRATAARIRVPAAGVRPAPPAGLIDPNEVAERDDRLVITLTLARVGLSAKTAAITAGTHPSEWSNAIAGKGRLDWGWLWQQDDEFWVEFWPLVAAAKNVTAENRAAVRRARLVEVLAILLEECA